MTDRPPVNRQDALVERATVPGAKQFYDENVRLLAGRVRDLERQLELAERAVAENRSERWNSIETKHAQRLEGRVRDLEAALRQIESLPDQTEDYSIFDTAVSIARAALAPAENGGNP